MKLMALRLSNQPGRLLIVWKGVQRVKQSRLETANRVDSLGIRGCADPGFGAPEIMSGCWQLAAGSIAEQTRTEITPFF